MTDTGSDTSFVKTQLDADTSAAEVVDSLKEKPGREDSSESKLDGTRRYYALYSVQPQRICSSSETEGDQRQENTHSMSVIATNLKAAAETDLRKSISMWLAKDAALPRKGRFSSVGLNLESEYSSSATCYSSVLESPATNPLADMSAKDSSEHGQFSVVSFISCQDSSLDLFRNEFDHFIQGLVPLLDKELSQLGTGIQTYLETWPVVVLGYLTRALQYMGPNVEHLIYAALSNASLHISGTTVEIEEDIRRFFRCCSLSSLVEQLQTDSGSHKSLTGSSDSAELWQLQAPVVTLTFHPEVQPSQDPSSGSQTSTVTMNPSHSCTFCKNATDKLLSLDTSNAIKVRDFLESIKLAFVHNLNKLKRFLKQAEVDYYALYRALCYLKKCGCGELLMQYVKLDGEPGTIAVLSALEIFIKDMNQSLT